MKNKFHSELFTRDITNKEKDFDKLVIAELLYRIYQIEKLNCYCFEHNKELEKYKSDLKKRLQPKTK